MRHLKAAGILLAAGVVLLLVIGQFSQRDDAVSEATPQPALSRTEVIRAAVSIPYSDLYRYIETHTGKIVKVTGRVLEVIGGSIPCDLRVATDPHPFTSGAYGWEDVVFVRGYRGDRLLEGDTVTVYGRVRGLISYKAVLGNTITLPSVEALYVDLIRGR